MRAACAGAAAAPPASWRERDHTDSDDNSDSAANNTTKGNYVTFISFLFKS